MLYSLLSTEATNRTGPSRSIHIIFVTELSPATRGAAPRFSLRGSMNGSMLLARHEPMTHRRKIMSIFGNIVSAIFGKSGAGSATAAGAPGTSSAAPTSSASAESVAPTGKPMSKAEVEAYIAKIDDQQDEDLDWKESIVDLMKLLKLDSSLAARKQLAQELGYTGALNGSAEMNIWLHKQVMTKLAEGGGKVPDSFKS